MNENYVQIYFGYCMDKYFPKSNFVNSLNLESLNRIDCFYFQP
jgi:hypothetical protein